MIIFPGGVRQERNFRRGGGGGPFRESIFGKSRGEGGHRKNPFRGGGGYGYFLELHNKLGFYLFADDTNLLYVDKNLKSGPGNRS